MSVIFITLAEVAQFHSISRLLTIPAYRLDFLSLTSFLQFDLTAEAWCKVMDSKKKEVLPILERAYGEGQGLKWYVNWRLFFM
jgi:hypothetical protein